MEWKDRIRVKKGDFGEKIIRQYLEKKGFVIYEPITNTAHAFDKLAIKDKKQVIIAEVKSKARLNKYNATGIDVRHYNEYRFIRDKYNIPVFLFFVDEMLGKIYGNKLNILEKDYIDKSGIEYPNTKIAKGIILFSLEVMKPVYDLSEQEVLFLKEHSVRKYDYKK